MDLADKLGLGEHFSPTGSALDLAGIAAQLGGQVQRTPWGSYILKEAVYPLDYAHGNRRLGVLLGYHGHGVGFLDSSFDQLDLERLVFFDTETTGLGRGSGTYIFLMGLGYFTPAGFKISQYFLPDYTEELAMLSALCAALEEKDIFVSFNGKAFDLPLLETRLICQRLPQPPVPRMHIDLLHLARRLWRGCLASCSLASLEANILGLRRIDDVPGYLIPEYYFRYLESGDAVPLVPVLKHNRLDILSMVTLLGLILETLTEPEQLNDPAMTMRVAKHYRDLGDESRAAALYEQVIREAPSSYHAPWAMRTLAKIRKREGRWPAAVQLWCQLANNGGYLQLDALEELAKYYEHQAKDYLQAIGVVHEALEWIMRDPLRRSLHKASLAQWEHRLRRLERKLRSQRKGHAQGQEDAEDESPGGGGSFSEGIGVGQ
ncbi:MAG TPA: hypothetical protein GXX57_03755 [Firmicutes bacterium]|nr:hypothetical protein [Bacillota bacterium]